MVASAAATQQIPRRAPPRRALLVRRASGVTRRRSAAAHPAKSFRSGATATGDDVDQQDQDIEDAPATVVETAEIAKLPLLVALEEAHDQLESAAQGLDKAIFEAKQAMTVLSLLKQQVQHLRAKIGEKTQQHTDAHPAPALH